jgi:hypothetical protein
VRPIGVFPFGFRSGVLHDIAEMDDELDVVGRGPLLDPFGLIVPTR